MPSLRERNRRNTLAITQRAAVEMFGARGFDAVKVTEIAREVGIAPSTLYRHFETKEAIVLWDEYELGYEHALEQTLGRMPPFDALREAFIAGIGDHYDADAAFQLRRVGLIYATPSIYAAAALANRRDCEELGGYLEACLSKKRRHAAKLLAATALLAVDDAFEHWLAANGSTKLSRLLARSFDAAGALAALR